MGNVLVFGNSHTKALKDALISRGIMDGNTYFNIYSLKSEKDGVTKEGDCKIEEAMDIVSNLNETDIVACSILGTGHNIFGLIVHDIPFCVINSNNAYLDGTHVIPSAQMYDMLFEHSKKNKKIVLLKKNTKAKVVLLMSPPPKGDDEYLRNKLKKYKGKILGDFDINHSSVLLNLWKIEYSAIAELCENLAIDLVPPPPEAVDDNGFLKKEYYGDDATHANNAYGELVLRQLEQINGTFN